jgi:hypothetical protein
MAEPTQEQVGGVVELLGRAKTAYGLFSGLKSKKMALTLVNFILCFTVGFQISEQTGNGALVMFALGVLPIPFYILGQSWVDGKQMDAIARTETEAP